MTDTRVIELEGVGNFRDLGGYAVRDGRTVRWRHVFRSANLDAITTKDLAVIAPLGLRVVYDLRRPGESENPSPLFSIEGAPRHVQLPMGGEVARDHDLVERVDRGEVPEITEEFMIGAYGTLLERHALDFGRALRGLSAEDGRPAVFNCAAGKDRTGLLAALLLALLGVDDETIVDDYTLTETLATARQAEHHANLRAKGLDPARFRPFWGAPPGVMAATLANLRTNYETVDSYLEDRANLSASSLTHLRETLLEG